MMKPISQWIDRHLDPSIRSDPELYSQVNIALILAIPLAGSCLLGCLLAYFHPALQEEFPFPVLPLMGAQLTLILSSIGLFRQKWVYKSLYLIVGLVSIQIIYSAYLLGGLNNVSLMWFPVIPIVAGVLAGNRSALTMALICLATLTCFWYLSHTGHQFPHISPPPSLIWILSGGGATVLSAAIVHHVTKQNNERRTAYEAEIARRTTVEQSLRHAQQRLRMAKTAAEAGSEAKGTFLAQISHEIRNPLTAIMGGIDLLALPAEPPVTEARMELLRRSANTLFELVEDVLDYSKIVQRKIEIIPTDIDVVELINEIERSYRPRAIETGIGLLLEVAPTTPATIWIDAIRVRQVLVNLIDNAFKFTTEGSITIEVSPNVDEDGTPVLTFGVEDTGIGIPETFDGHLFEPYKQAERSTTERYGGTGLGLPICYHLVTLMNGQLGFETEVGVGSRFWFSLPIEQQATDHKTQDHSANKHPIKAKVLLVENDPLNRQIVGELIESLGHTVTLADGGAAGVNQYQNEQPDLVLMDIQMPGMNGIDATRQIRQWEDEQEQSHVPILAMTADLEIQQISNYGTAGMNGLLSKPVNRDKLEEAIQGWAVRRGVEHSS
jgi:signal transduction histidine kinase/ActR/RegA family two-component response regulator